VRAVDEPGRVPDVGGGFDTDGDGAPDTAVSVDGIDLVVAIDVDGDGFADQVLRIGRDATVREQGVAGWTVAPSDAEDQ
jgi:hypothetical protein